MFRGSRAKAKLKKHGYTIQVSQGTRNCYVVYRISDGKRVGLIWWYGDGWSEQHSQDIRFSTPEEAALLRWGDEFL